MMNQDNPFLSILVERNVLSEEDSVKLKKAFNGDPYRILIRLAKGLRGGLINKTDLGKIWGDIIGFPFIDLKKTLFQGEVVHQLPEKLAKEHCVIPVYQFGEAITVASPQPGNQKQLLEIETAMQKKVSLVFAFPDEIKTAIDVQYKSSQYLKELTKELEEKFGFDDLLDASDEMSTEKLREITGSQVVVELVRGIMLFALKEAASDIHIEPYLNKVVIRFRVDGILEEKLQLEKALLLPLVSRIKILANLDITERRRPQDGKITMEIEDIRIDFRFSSIPAIYGEKVVLRLLGQLADKSIPDLEDLDFSPPDLIKMKRLISTPNGVVFVTGPTGAGKTTTLFAALKYLNKPGVNILTIEDPVEYQLDGVNQVQVNPLINVNFANALRAFLRQDPDVILVGEVRDVETARIASQAALTGHLVLTSMHTNNALQAVTRLIEIGVEPFLVAPSVIGILSQRLVRRICLECKESYSLSPEEIENLFIWDGKREVTFYRGKGCKECKFTGYHGRMAIYEMFILDEDIKDMVARSASIREIQKQAWKSGFKDLRYNGIKAVLKGMTSIEEVDKVTLSENIRILS